MLPESAGSTRIGRSGDGEQSDVRELIVGLQGEYLAACPEAVSRSTTSAAAAEVAFATSEAAAAASQRPSRAHQATLSQASEAM